MKKVSILVIGMAVAVLFNGCSKPASSTSSSGAPASGVAATAGGVSISMEELNQAAKSQLQKVETEIYQVKKRTLDGLIEEKLIEEAAKKKGLSSEKFLAEEIDAKVTAPTDEEIKALYESSKDKLGKPFEEVRGQITDYLKQNRKMRARADLMASLRQGADVKINLEPPRVTIDTKDAPSIGPKDAAITLVEFSDYQCPFCKRVRPSIWRLTDEYKDKLRYVFMDFPLAFHKDAKKAHEAAHCAADQGKYFEFNRKIFDNQSKIGVADLKTYAKELQLNAKDFDKCLDGGKHTKLVDDLTQRGAAVGVTGTPAYFINGIMLSGAMPYESFKEIIDSELKR